MSDLLATPLQPPRKLNFEGKRRRVGIEIEFAAMSARSAAATIADRFGGQVRELSKHRFKVDTPVLGTFEAELDSRFAHPDAYPTLAANLEGEWIAEVRKLVSEFFGDVGSLVIPCEIVAPPLEIERVAELDALLEDLRRRGAQGTSASLFYAFGVHLNPDIASTEPDWLLRVLKASIVLSDWLRAVMEIDLSRELTGFATQFPADYCDKVLAKNYAPNQRQLIEDYLAHNPTRDRELDLLPLFCWLDEGLVRSHLPAEKIGRRPTFHFRLPNAALEQPRWSVAREWNRWILIEQLAEDAELLTQMGEAYQENNASMEAKDWAMMSSEWLSRALQRLTRS